MEYLYSQTGRVLQDASVDPDIPDEEPAIQELNVEDEGFEEASDDEDDPTIHVDLPLPDASSSSSAAATRSGVHAGAPRSVPSVPGASPDDDSNNPPEAPELEVDAPQNSSSDTEVRVSEFVDIRVCVCVLVRACVLRLFVCWPFYSLFPFCFVFPFTGVPRP